jgi:hypothetical protein
VLSAFGASKNFGTLSRRNAEYTKILFDKAIQRIAVQQDPAERIRCFAAASLDTPHRDLIEE